MPSLARRKVCRKCFERGSPAWAKLALSQRMPSRVEAFHLMDACKSPTPFPDNVHLQGRPDFSQPACNDLSILLQSWSESCGPKSPLQGIISEDEPDVSGLDLC